MDRILEVTDKWFKPICLVLAVVSLFAVVSVLGGIEKNTNESAYQLRNPPCIR